jgi:hypothetical protein
MVARDSRAGFRICRRSSIISAEYFPCFHWPLRSPLGAPLLGAPPCIRHLPRGVAGGWHGIPRRVLAKQRGAWRKGDGSRVIGCMGLSLDSNYLPIGPGVLSVDTVQGTPGGHQAQRGHCRHADCRPVVGSDPERNGLQPRHHCEDCQTDRSRRSGGPPSCSSRSTSPSLPSRQWPYPMALKGPARGIWQEADTDRAGMTCRCRPATKPIRPAFFRTPEGWVVARQPGPP